MTKKSNRTFFCISTKELKLIVTFLGASVTAAVVISYRTMQQHPDSMISGGLRWLSEGPVSFQYNTYGPFSYFIYGVLSLVYFGLGFLFGFWHSPSEFEIAYRINSLNFGNLKFSVFYLTLNILMLIQSLNLLMKSSKNSSFRKKLVFVLSISTPITLFQFTLETVEPVVFFGISLTIYTFSNAQKLINTPKLLFLLSTLSWLFTFGVRISTLPIVLLYSLASAIDMKQVKEKTLLYSALTFAVLVSIASYSPVFLDRENFEYVISLNRLLATSSFKISTITDNLETFKLNLGFWIPLLIVAMIYSIKMWKKENIFIRTRIILILLFSSLYLVNQNGHPKYLIPLIPLVFSLMMDLELPKSEKNGFLINQKVRAGCFSIVLLVGGLQATRTAGDFIANSNFDSRQEVKKFILKFPDWTSSILVTDNVLAEITRGPDPRDYTSLRKEVFLGDRNQACAGVLVLSSTSYSRDEAQKRLLECKRVGTINYLVTISPFNSSQLPQGKKHWRALLSLGTSEDVNRIGYGPVYWVGVYRDFNGSTSDPDLCSNIKGCKFSRF